MRRRVSDGFSLGGVMRRCNTVMGVALLFFVVSFLSSFYVFYLCFFAGHLLACQPLLDALWIWVNFEKATVIKSAAALALGGSFRCGGVEDDRRRQQPLQRPTDRSCRPPVQHWHARCRPPSWYMWASSVARLSLPAGAHATRLG